MPKITHVKKAQKAQGNCRRAGCGKSIKVGDAYYWFANRIGRHSSRKVFCGAHRPKPSEITTSEKLSQLYGAQETLDEEIPKVSSYEDLVQALNDAAEQAREVSEGYRESLSNMPEGLQQGSTGQDIEAKADEIENWADQLESAANDIEGMDHEIDDDAECTTCGRTYAEHIEAAAAEGASETKDDEPKDEPKDNEPKDDEPKEGETLPESGDKPNPPCDDFTPENDPLEEARNCAEEASGSLSV